MVGQRRKVMILIPKASLLKAWCLGCISVVARKFSHGC